MILVLTPVLNVVGYSIDWKKILVITYGGLRGAISLSLALFISRSEDVHFTEEFKDLTIFYVTGTIAFTVLINGTTIKYLILKIKLVEKSKLDEILDVQIRRRLVEEIEAQVSLLKQQI